MPKRNVLLCSILNGMSDKGGQKGLHILPVIWRVHRKYLLGDLQNLTGAWAVLGRIKECSDRGPLGIVFNYPP